MAGFGPGDCPTGKSVALLWICAVKPFPENIFCFSETKITYMSTRPVPLKGRFAIVTDAGRDAVDADALLTNGAEADGKGVWFWHPDAGVKSARRSAGDGGQQARSTGKITKQPLKPLRGECRVVPVYSW